MQYLSTAAGVVAAKLCSAPLTINPSFNLHAERSSESFRMPFQAFDMSF
jgi:hypothetical protein